MYDLTHEFLSLIAYAQNPSDVSNGKRVLMVCLSHTLYAIRKYSGETVQWRYQNAEKDTHVKGRLLEQAVILFICVKMRTSLKGKNLLQGGANSFRLDQLLLVWTFTTLGDLP